MTVDMVSQLAAGYTGEEVIQAVFQMHPLKAPGPDGMSTMFYQQCWEVIGSDVVSTVLNVLNNKAEISDINHTHIVLIPNKKVCKSLADFRPIVLCNVVYKIV